MEWEQTRTVRLCFRTPLSQAGMSVCQATSFFFVPLVPGFSTASYLKVHIKTHHGSPLPPSATMHTFPEPRGELQMHNGNPYHMGRQCSVEGKQPPAPSQTFMFLAFICSAAVYLFIFFGGGETCCCISVYVNTRIHQLLLPSFLLKHLLLHLHLSSIARLCDDSCCNYSLTVAPIFFIFLLMISRLIRHAVSVA